MKRKRIKTVAITFFSMISLLAGCGKETVAEVPELLEPVSVNEAYRPVSYGEVGELEVVCGTVKCQEYPHFYATSATVTNIPVEIGDYVEAGDVLAYGDVEEAKETLADLKQQLSNEKKSYEISEKILSLELQQTTDSVAKASGKNLYVRLECPSEIEYTVGDNCLVYFMEKDLGKVLMRGKDSVFQDGQGTYAYVKNAEGKKEKRQIEIGVKDEYYVQVIRGLQEGELVFYESGTQLPIRYVTGKVTPSDFSMDNHSKIYQISYGKTHIQESEHNGTILTMAVEEEQEVEKGQLLYEVRSDTGKAALTEAKSQIDRQKESDQKALARMDKQIAESTDIQKEILKLERQQMVINQETTMKNLTDYYNKLKGGNDGTGGIQVYAKAPGIVTGLQVREGDEIYNGQTICSIRDLDESLVLVQMKNRDQEICYTSDIAQLGEEVTFENVNDSVTVHCVGWVCAGENISDGYAYTDENGTHLSYCSASGYSDMGFYVRLSEEDQNKDIFKGTVTFSYLSLENVMVLSKSMIYTEKVGTDSKEKYYVWKVENGELEKQYVRFWDEDTIDGKVIILSGISAGDTLAEETR